MFNIHCIAACRYDIRLSLETGLHVNIFEWSGQIIFEATFQESNCRYGTFAYSTEDLFSPFLVGNHLIALQAQEITRIHSVEQTI